MILTADEVLRSLRGSLRLIQREADGLRAFDVSLRGFWHSFAAIVLTAPAFVVFLAEARLRAGLYQPGTFLLDNMSLVLREALAYTLAWIAFPVAMIGFVRLMGLERRYIGYVVAYNWSNVIASFVMAFPALMNVLGLVPPEAAALYAVTFLAIIAQYRWFLARAALGVSGGLAALLVGFDLALDIGLGTLLRLSLG